VIIIIGEGDPSAEKGQVQPDIELLVSLPGEIGVAERADGSTRRECPVEYIIVGADISA
jgi:hypothetical protein